MKQFKLRGLLQNSGWLSPAFVSTDEAGRILSISSSGPVQVDNDLPCYAVPGFQNAHSHAFQYAMAGLAERHSTSQTPDDFWSWRDSMYRLALQISPDQLEAIAAMLYAEMMRHGYTHVAEFHYVHHDQNGKPYDQLSAMGERLIAAAKTVGIGITLIPIFYQKGGFGKDPVDGQKRFISSTKDDYFKLFEASLAATKYYEHANIALGIHSLRGVEPEIVKEIALDGPQDVPFHIHISEQLKEVSDSLDYFGKRPVQWMLDNCQLNSRFHLVHATHLNDSETIGLAQSGAHVVLCPSTEGNLGDGIFQFIEYRNAGGKWSIGTDSHIGLNPMEELRILDYGQRLTSHKRNIFYSAQQGDAGMFALEMITRAGRSAMNNSEEEFFKIGDFFNAALFDAKSPLIETSSAQNLASTLVYASDPSMQCGVISHGKYVRGTRQDKVIEEVEQRFKNALRELANRI